MAGGRTEYLSELHTGSQVVVVDALGHTRSVLVGRVKIESRPLLLVEVEVDGQRHSVLLQNAETVCLVAPGGESWWNGLLCKWIRSSCAYSEIYYFKMTSISKN